MARTKQTARLNRDGKKSKKQASKALKTEKKRALKAVRKSALPSVGGIKKPHRFRAGVQAEREIRRLTGSGKEGTKMLMQRAKVERLVREIGNDCSTRVEGVRWQAKAIDAVWAALEYGGVRLLQKTRKINAIRKRVTIVPEALHLAAEMVFGENYFSVRAAAAMPVQQEAKKQPRKQPKARVVAPSSSSSSSDETVENGADEAAEQADEAAPPADEATTA